MRNAHGYLVGFHADGKVSEHDSFSCSHCNAHRLVPPKQRPEDMGGLCKQCMGLICPACVAKGACTPWEKQLQAQEARDRLYAAARGA